MDIKKLTAYRMVDSPIKPPEYRMVPMTKAEAEALEYLGRGLCKLGADRTGLMCIRLAVSWDVSA